MPKSASSASPSCSRMFSGLMSRWTIPCRCAKSSAPATCRVIRIVFVDRQQLLAREPVAQRLALHERHHIEQRTVRASRIVQRQDVRVLQIGGDLDLLEEALRAEGRRELRLEHLERDLPVVPEVVSQVHRRHAALAELSLDAVAVGECGLQLFKCRRELGHASPVGRGQTPIEYSAGLAIAISRQHLQLELLL